jgi:hypothetical protein
MPARASRSRHALVAIRSSQARNVDRPLEGLPPTPGTGKRLLHGVLGVLERPQHPVAVHVQLAWVTLRQPRERRLVDLAQFAHSQLLHRRVRMTSPEVVWSPPLIVVLLTTKAATVQRSVSTCDGTHG